MGPYESQKKSIVHLLKACNQQSDDIKSLPLFEDAYYQLIDLERLVNAHQTELVIAEEGKKSWKKDFALRGLGIVISILVGNVVGKYLAIWFL